MNPVRRRALQLFVAFAVTPAAYAQEQSNNRAFTLEEWATIHKIRREFEKNSDLISALYRRALKENPSLKGIIRLEMIISPAGDVLECTIESSDFKSALMGDLLPEIVSDMKFKGLGNKEVLVVTYPIEFLP